MPNKIELAALAQLLQNVYTEMEHVFKVIAEDVDGAVLNSSSWHRDLLDLMCDPGSRRPALLSPALYEELNSYRTFRHFARNATVLVLEWDRMQPLVCSSHLLPRRLHSSTHWNRRDLPCPPAMSGNSIGAFQATSRW